jgi:hypothetical protein
MASSVQTLIVDTRPTSTPWLLERQRPERCGCSHCQRSLEGVILARLLLFGSQSPESAPCARQKRHVNHTGQQQSLRTAPAGCWWRVPWPFSSRS